MPTAAPRRVLASAVALALGLVGTLVAVPAHAAPTTDPLPLSPLGGAVTSDRTPELRWSPGASSWPDSLRYGVEVLDASGGWVRGTLVDLVFDDDWSPLIPLPDGAYSWRVRGVDGIWSEGPWSAPASFVVDRTAPDLTLTSPASGLFSGAGVVIAGTIADANPGTWQISVDGTVVQSGTGTSFSHTVYPATGAHTISVTAVDAAGNSDAGSSASVAIDVDAEAPSLALTSPVDGSFVRPGPNVRFIASVAATGTRADLVLDVDGSTIHSVSTTTTRDVNRPVATSSWVDGSTHVFQAVATDRVGQSATLSATVTADGSDPVVDIDAPGRHDLLAGDVAVTGTATDTGSGVADVTLDVRPFDAASSTCAAATAQFAAVLEPSGSWSATIGSAGLPDGDYCLRARATDGVGNTGADQVKYVTVDNSAPAGTLEGTHPSGWHMSVDHVAWTALTDAHGLSYEVALGAHPNVDAAGLMTELSWVVTGITTNRYDVDIPTGPHFYQVRAVDELGNATPWTAPRGFQVIGVPVIVSPTEGQQFSASTITATWTPVYGVGGVDRYEIEYGLDRDHDGVLSPEYRSVAGTGWNDGANVSRVQSFPAAAGLPTGYEGPLSIRVRAVYEIAYPNSAGSVVGPWSAPVVHYVRDTGEPTLVVSAPAAGALVTGDDDIPVTLEAADPAGISRLVANLHTASGFVQEIGSTPVGGALGTTVTTTWDIPAGLADGEYEIHASATDAAGTTTHVRRDFTVDGTAPVVTFASPASNSAHSRTVTVSGTATDAGSGVARLRLIVRAYDGATARCSGAARSFTVPVATDGSWDLALDTTTFADGVYCIIGHARDVAGNDNGRSTRLRGVTFDNLGPAAPQPYNPENGRTQANANPLLDWLDVADAVSYEVRTSTSSDRVGGGAVHDGELNGSDAVTSAPVAASELQLTGLPQGLLFWQVRGIDAFGNAGRWSNIWALGVDTVGPAVALLSPGPGAVLATGDFTLDWTDGEAGATYQLRSSPSSSTDGDGALDVSVLTGTASTSEYPLVGVPDATYFWQVRALDALGNAGPWTDPRAVTVDTTGPAVSLVSPADGAVLTTGDVTLDWSDGESGATYELRSSLDPSVDGDGMLDVDAASAATTVSELPVTGVLEGTYHWQARAIDAHGNAGPWTEVWSLVVDLPTLPETEEPGNEEPGTGGTGAGTGGAADPGPGLVDLTTFALEDGATEDGGADGDSDETGTDDETDAGTTPGATGGSSTPGLDVGTIALLVGVVAALLLLLVVLLAWLRRRRAAA